MFMRVLACRDRLGVALSAHDTSIPRMYLTLIYGAPILDFARRHDLLPSFRTKLSMISRCGKGEEYVEESGKRGADDRRTEATGEAGTGGKKRRRAQETCRRLAVKVGISKDSTSRG